jgi:hypothetical protein
MGVTNSQLDKILEALGADADKSDGPTWHEMTHDEKLNHCRKVHFILDRMEEEGKPIPECFAPLMDIRKRMKEEDEIRRAKYGQGWMPGISGGSSGTSSELMTKLGSPPPQPDRSREAEIVSPAFEQQRAENLGAAEIERDRSMPPVIRGPRRWSR